MIVVVVEFWDVGFGKGEKLENQEKNPEQCENQQQLMINPHDDF